MPIDRNQEANYDATSNSFHDFSDKTKDVMSEKKMLDDTLKKALVNGSIALVNGSMRFWLTLCIWAPYVNLAKLTKHLLSNFKNVIGASD